MKKIVIIFLTLTMYSCVVPVSIGNKSFLDNENNFRDVIENSLSEANNGRLITFGIKPYSPETGYGYINSYEELDENLNRSDNNIIELEIVETNQEDSLLRALVEEEDKYNAFDIQGERFTTVLFPPVKGGLSSAFDINSKHYGVDIVMPENSPVHSISEGVVVFSEWTSATGFVIIIEHLNGLTSIYKHNSSIVKNQGDRVGTGEIIAFTGNTGELTTGPHLHFELWYQGEPVDPQSYIEF